MSILSFRLAPAQKCLEVDFSRTPLILDGILDIPVLSSEMRFFERAFKDLGESRLIVSILSTSLN